jgi:hypothetical protein
VRRGKIDPRGVLEKECLEQQSLKKKDYASEERRIEGTVRAWNNGYFSLLSPFS